MRRKKEIFLHHRKNGIKRKTLALLDIEKNNGRSSEQSWLKEKVVNLFLGDKLINFDDVKNKEKEKKKKEDYILRVFLRYIIGSAITSIVAMLTHVEKCVPLISISNSIL